MRSALLPPVLLFAPMLSAQAPAPDTLIFTSGEQLTGSLEKANADGITFKSPVAGELTVKWANIKELRSDKNFAVLTQQQKLTRRNAEAVVPQGKVSVADKQITVETSTGKKVVPVEKADRLVDAAAFDKAVRNSPSLLDGWGGLASGGVSLVRATQNSTNFNGAISLLRVVPAVDWLPAHSRATVDYSQAYGTTSQANLLPVKTNIFHAATEYDRYFSPRAYGFGGATFDHNFSQLLALTQAYGGGLGVTVLKSAPRQLDFKGDIHYEKQQFLADVVNNLPAAPTQNLIGSTFSEKYLEYLAKGLVFNEFASISPSWNNTNAYAAHVNASLGFPVYKGLGFSIGAVDDYLNNAPLGAKKNSVQYSTNLTYTIKPR